MKLYDGVSIIGELGESDLILFSGSRTIRKGAMIMDSPFGQEGDVMFPKLSEQLARLLTQRNKGAGAKKNKDLYGLIIHPNVADDKGTKIGLWQVKYDYRESVNIDVCKYSLSILSGWLDRYDRVAIELPTAQMGMDDDKLRPSIERLPNNVVFYRSYVKRQGREIDPSAISHSVGQRLKYERHTSQNDFHRR